MNIMSVVGILALIGIAYIFSTNRKAIKWRTVLAAFAVQFTFAFLVLFTSAGRSALQWISGGVQNVLNTANDGIAFVFGTAVGGDNFVFAFQVLPIIIFMSSLIALLYYLGVMQWVIRILGTALAKALGTSRKESLSATANIFVGQTEAPLVIKPYLPTMTQSELFAVMVGGLASVAGSVLAGYAALGVPLEYLLAASFMAAPAGLLFAKIIVPETEEYNDDIEIAEDEEDKAANFVDAAARGASDGLFLALNVGAMLLAFVSLIALVNLILGGIGGLFGFDSLSLELILGYVFAPLAFVIGVPWADAVQFGSFLGQKLVLNEFVAFSEFAPVIGTGELSARTEAMIAFALCGFANISSLAILLGGLGGMAPNRRNDIARMGVLAILAGTLANLMSATLAGLLL
ncbi:MULTISPECIES: NupC/NupG family nucleoside CNT transporter [Exiguobacterium]|uniref:NupC/NupG family nucleoside CNT transporter n=1 Tax=Exiguobacterium TaxID=33986 RepID=UPI001BE58394|nr:MULTISPECIES: NupC/NupG family nucleoside CNT transporter [Exiguobacterium]MCT4777815.1 NupC/NupG family nucleoside CNT transporter [Exiguobacterium aquaticum]MCT4787842.1 NupC/NupG family nucleoside CNT transporter [Exiguobacterium mexicanum]